MATRNDLVTALESLGIPCYYGQSIATPVSSMPAVSYRFVLDSSSYADGRTWSKAYRYDVELDEAEKDFALESSMCAALASAGIDFDRIETTQDGWIETTFEVELDD